MAGEGDMKPTTADALAYINKIKDAFSNELGNYQCFLNLVKDLKNKRIDSDGFIVGVREIFKGHVDLLLGFNMFCPAHYQITLPMKDDQPAYFEDKIKEYGQVPMHGGYEEVVDFSEKTQEGKQCPNNKYEKATDFMEDEQAPKRMHDIASMLMRISLEEKIAMDDDSYGSD